jgi:hypothetical protein
MGIQRRPGAEVPAAAARGERRRRFAHRGRDLLGSSSMPAWVTLSACETGLGGACARRRTTCLA